MRGVRQEALLGLVLLASLLLASAMMQITPLAPAGAEPGSVHDVALVDVKPVLPYGALRAYPTWLVNVSVVVGNEGDFPETFNVTVYYDPRFYLDEDNVIGTQSVADLPPGENRALTFTWKVPGITVLLRPLPSERPRPANYTISAEASAVPGEADTADNAYTDGNVTVWIYGDAGPGEGDGYVTVTDLGILGRCWGNKYGQADYDWRADFNGDGIISISDLGILGRWWYYHV